MIANGTKTRLGMVLLKNSFYQNNTRMEPVCHWYNQPMVLVVNKNAKREYEITKTYTGGLVLTGPEVKSLRQKKASLKGSFVRVMDGQLFLVNAQINPYDYADNTDYDPKRTRTILVARREIAQIMEATARKNVTAVPLAIKTAGRFIKLEFGIGRGKKQYEKRADLKKKALQRDVERETKHQVRL
jgi:SsrA-binding protein